MKTLPSSSKRTSTLSRVVPGTSLVIIRSACTSVLTSVLLPTLRRPTIATFMTASSGASSSGTVAGSFSRMAFSSSVLAAVLLRADADQLPPQLVELVGLRVQRRGVGLVGHADHRHVDVAEPLGHLLVQRRQTGPRVDHQEDQVGRVDGRLDLALDVLAEVVAVLHAHAAGIDQLDEPRLPRGAGRSRGRGSRPPSDRRWRSACRPASSRGSTCPRWAGRQ